MRRYNHPEDNRNYNRQNHPDHPDNRNYERYTDRPYHQHPNEYRQQPYQQRINENDYLNSLYDTSNYDGIPDRENYGRTHSNQEYGHQIEPYPETRNWYSRLDNDHYHTYHGYDLNYDNPNEGVRYRNWDVRGNYGYRHDPSYGHSDNMIGYNDSPYELERERKRNSNRNDYWW